MKKIPVKITCSSDLGTLKKLKDIRSRASADFCFLQGAVCFSSRPSVTEGITEGHRKQLSKWEVVVAASTTACRCVLWEEDIDEV